MLTVSAAARFDFYLASGQSGELRGRAMRGPVAHHEHLHGRWRVARDGEKLRGLGGFGPFVAITQADFFGLHFDGFVNVRQAGILAFDFERRGRQIACGAKCSGERHGGAAIGELEIDFYVQRIAVARDLVGFFADGLLEFVQDEFSLFDGARGDCAKAVKLQSGLARASTKKRCE